MTNNQETRYGQATWRHLQGLITQLSSRFELLGVFQAGGVLTISKIVNQCLVLQTETKQLRVALDEIARLAEAGHLLLDKLETEAGLVDNDGKRYDEE